jgi:adenosylmethionine-8-amino-7-oxononanoate aminotransferase
MSSSRELQQKAPRATRPQLVMPDVLDGAAETFVEGHGDTLITSDGRSVIDAVSGIGVTCLGYDVPGVVQRMAEQAARLQFAHALHFDTPPAQELAARVAGHAPDGLDWAFFVSGGSEAMESAIKFARQYWLERDRPGKWRVIGRWPSFHGSTIATLSAGWHQARRSRHKPLLLDFPHIEAPNLYRGCSHCREAGGCTLACADELERALIREGADTISAFIAEPVAGAAGAAATPDDGYFARIRAICDHYEVLFIADEVITGFGRTGRWFAIDHWDVVPDMIVFAKGISAGFVPLGGFVAKTELMRAFARGSGRFEHNFTMVGHPVACATGCAVLDELERIDAPARVQRDEPALFAALGQLLAAPLVGDVRGKGFLAGIELVSEPASKTPFEPHQAVAARVADAALAEGLLVYPCGGSADGSGDHLLIMPALNMATSRFTEIAELLGRALAAVGSELGVAG